MSEASYYLRLSGLLQRLVRVFHTQAYRYSLHQGISLSECRVLFLLRNGMPVKMNKIKHNLFVTGAFVTNIADQLVRHKLVVRQRSDKDRRKVIITLTDKGKHYLAELAVYRRKFFKAFLDGLNKEDRRIMERGISILVDSLESMKRI
ncbi:MAG: MarR family transcriptional regulator [Candidatus Omnitrophota bacterium]